MDINFTTISNDEYKKSVNNFEISYGFIKTNFGECLVGIHNKKICHIAFFDDGKENSAIDKLQTDWPNSTLKEDNDSVLPIAKGLFDDKDVKNSKFEVLLRGTEMQVNVWKELTKLKAGSTYSYENIAKAIGKPSAIRAIANVIASNRVAYLIPCHRVISKTGKIGKYKWGVERKKLILKKEKAV